jgi:hypothetical protein
MTEWLPIRYREFYDVPRVIAVQYQGVAYLFDSPFDDGRDGYPESYVVYRLPASAVPELERAAWHDLPRLGERIAEVPLEALRFDLTKRRSISADIFKRPGITP